MKFAARVLDGMPAKDLKPMADEMKKQVGTWTVKQKCWEDPTKPATESTGRAASMKRTGRTSLRRHRTWVASHPMVNVARANTAFEGVSPGCRLATVNVRTKRAP